MSDRNGTLAADAAPCLQARASRRFDAYLTGLLARPGDEPNDSDAVAKAREFRTGQKDLAAARERATHVALYMMWICVIWGVGDKH